eukprot:2698022-Prymnesium_polylepis.1
MPLVEGRRAAVEAARDAVGPLEHRAARAEPHGAAHVRARHLRGAVGASRVAHGRATQPTPDPSNTNRYTAHQRAVARYSAV